MKSRLKELIARNDLSNEEVSKLLGVSRETVSKWANNKVKPSLETAFKLADLLACKVDDLYKRD